MGRRGTARAGGCSYLMTSPVSHGCCHDDAAAKLVMQGYFSCLASGNKLQLSVLCFACCRQIVLFSCRVYYFITTDFLFDYVLNVCSTLLYAPHIWLCCVCFVLSNCFYFLGFCSFAFVFFFVSQFCFCFFSSRCCSYHLS